MLVGTVKWFDVRRGRLHPNNEGRMYSFATQHRRRWLPFAEGWERQV
jgi:hypothetical protein